MTTKRIIELAGSSFLLAALAIAPIVGGCNPNGYPELWVSNDPAIPCDGETTTWIRNYLEPGYAPGEEDLALRTEFLVVRSEYDAVTGDPVFATDGCMHLATIQRDGSIRLEQGTFFAEPVDPAVPAVPGGGNWQIARIYEFIHEPELKILDRTGAQTFEQDPIIETELAMAASGDDMTMTIGGEEAHFTNMLPLLGTLDVSDASQQANATMFAQLVNVAALFSQVRIRGFGGKGMTEYLSTSKVFGGLISGAITMNADLQLATGSVDASLEYTDFADFSGFSMVGPQIVSTDFGGDGEMRGAQDFVIEVDRSDPTRDVLGTFDYTGVLIEDGFGGGGGATITLNGIDFMVATDQVLITDFRSILPLD